MKRKQQAQPEHVHRAADYVGYQTLSAFHAGPLLANPSMSQKYLLRRCRLLCNCYSGRFQLENVQLSGIECGRNAKLIMMDPLLAIELKLPLNSLPYYTRLKDLELDVQ